MRQYAGTLYVAANKRMTANMTRIRTEFRASNSCKYGSGPLVEMRAVSSSIEAKRISPRASAPRSNRRNTANRPCRRPRRISAPSRPAAALRRGDGGAARSGAALAVASGAAGGGARAAALRRNVAVAAAIDLRPGIFEALPAAVRRARRPMRGGAIRLARSLAGGGAFALLACIRLEQQVAL